MKKICLLLSIAVALSTLGVTSAFATEAKNTEINESVSVVSDKLMIFSEDFQGLKRYGDVLGEYNRTDNTNLPSGWADARNLAAFKASEDATSGFVLNSNYTNYWNVDDLATFTEDKNNGTWTKESLHAHVNAGGDPENIALGISTSAGGNAYNGSTGTGAEHGGYVKYFTNGVATGDFTLEFDVLVKNGGGWSLGLIPYDNYDAAITMGSYGSSTANPTKNYTYNRNNYWAANKYLYERATLSHIIGQMKGDNSVYVPVGVGKAFNTTNFTPLKDETGANVTMTNTFVSGDTSPLNHIKIDFNLSSGVHKVTITDGALNTTKTYGWKDNTPGRFEKGVMGIALRKHNDTEALWSRVLFDNIQVYKNNAYFIEQNFDGYNTTSNRVPGGWYRWDDQLAKKGTVEIFENYFNTPGAAIMFESDGRKWFESGGTTDVKIIDNVFENCLYGNSDNWGNAVIDFMPRIDFDGKNYYHKEVEISKNKFINNAHYIVRANNIESISVADNDIINQIGEKAIFENCRDVQCDM